MSSLARVSKLAASLVSFFGFASLAVANQNYSRVEQLGFSADGKSLVLAQTIVDGGVGGTSASVMVVDIAKNACVQGGCVNARGAIDGEPRPAGAALKEVLSKTWKLRKGLGLTPPLAGTKLLETGRSQSDDKTLFASYRDERNNRTISVGVTQVQVPGSSASGEYVPERASLEISLSDGHFQKIIDDVNRFRPYVQSYDLKEVRLSPNGRGIAIIFDKVSLGFEGSDHLTFVETTDFPAFNR